MIFFAFVTFSNVDNKKNILIFLNGGFPFGNAETFSEIEKLNSKKCNRMRSCV